VALLKQIQSINNTSVFDLSNLSLEASFRRARDKKQAA
jgi:hypothetical protein